MKKYERFTSRSRLYMRRKLYGIQYTGQSTSGMNPIMTVVTLLRGLGKPLIASKVIAILLSVPESYLGLVTAL